METTTVKRSPIVLIRLLAAIEGLAFIFYFLATLLGNAKYEFYAGLFFSDILPYQIAKLLFLSGAQFIITIYAFLNWYYESYCIAPNTITHRWGVLFKKERSVALNKDTSFTLASGPLGKLLHYGSLSVQNGGIHNSLVMATISRPEHCLDSIKRGIGGAEASFGNTPPDIHTLLAQAEHGRLEFKSSLRFDYKNGGVNHDLEKSVMKTIAAFLNSQGGQVLIGVSDAKKALGLTHDYGTLKRPDSDGFENHFTQVFNKMIGPEFRHLVKLWFKLVENKEVCVIRVAASPRPVYLKFDSSERFYVRTGNITTDLTFSEVESYKRSRWPKTSV